MIAIIGGGLAGCCVALELARHGVRSKLFEANATLMNEASRWNEVKLHLGFVYGNDPSLRTARSMIEGSVEFCPILEELLGIEIDETWLSKPFEYGVPHTSMLNVEAIEAHFSAVQGMFNEMTSSKARPFGKAHTPGAVERKHSLAGYNEDEIAAAFTTPEVAVDPHLIAEAVIGAVRSSPQIEVIHGVAIARVGCGDGGAEFEDSQGNRHSGFKHIVNCSWRSLLALDRSIGLERGGNWLYRYKYALHVPNAPALEIPSATFTLGPFGDIVTFSDGQLYLSWYPSCRTEITDGERPEESRTALCPDQNVAMVRESLRALNSFVPGLPVSLCEEDVAVNGGWILGAGTADIDKAESGLHRRHDGGLSSGGGYHSFYSAKYAIIPLLAKRFVETRFVT